MEIPTVSVVVPTYGRRENLVRVIHPLLDDAAATEVIVVVDGSRDGSYELLQELAADEPRLRALFIENRGSAHAYQAGIEHASGEVILLLDDDVIAAPGLVTGHARRHAEGTERVVVGYMPIRIPRRRTPGAFASYLYAREYEHACQRYEERPLDILLGLWGGNVSLRRADCLRVPVASEHFGERYHEDRDFGIRCLRAGLVGVFDRSLLAEHAHARSLQGVARDAWNQGVGKALVHRLHADLVGPFDPAIFEASLPAPVRGIVRLCRRPGARRSAVPLLTVLVRAAGWAHLLPLELRAAQLLRRIEMQAGALAVMRAAGESDAGVPRLLVSR